MELQNGVDAEERFDWTNWGDGEKKDLGYMIEEMVKLLLKLEREDKIVRREDCLWTVRLGVVDRTTFSRFFKVLLY